MIQLKNVEAWYGSTQVLFGVNLQVEPSKVLALVGTNGAGKTSIIRSIMRLIRTRGQISINHQEVSRVATHDLVRNFGVAAVNEEQPLFGNLTVKQNLELGSTQRSRAHMHQIVEMFPIVQERWASPISLLSGGQRQLVALARSLTLSPKFLLLDEPSLGLSPAMTDLVYEQIALVKAEMNVGILLVEQNTNRARSVADQLQLIAMGESQHPILADDHEALVELERKAFGAYEVDSGFTEVL